MQQKQIQVGSNKLLVLDMPEGATYANASELMMNNLTDIEYEIVGLKDDITEEQWAEIVESEKFIRESGEIDWYFKDYESSHKMHELLFSNDNATESGLSLLQANNCNYKNALIIRVI